MMWLGEKTEFKFTEAVDAETQEKSDLIIELVTTAWSVPPTVRALCSAMAAARGHDSAERELSGVLTGEFDITVREIHRQGSNWHSPISEHVAASMLQSLDSETVDARLSVFAREAGNPSSAAAYVLDAALSRWGYFIGNLRFEEPRDPRRGITVTYTIPRTPDELRACLQPWFAQLPHDEAREALEGAARAALELEGAKCRELVELASVSVPPVEEIADTEPPEQA